MKKKATPAWNQTHSPSLLIHTITNGTTTMPLRLIIIIPLKIYEYQLRMMENLSSGLHMQGPPKNTVSRLK